MARCDMFLKIQGVKQGMVNGESTEAKHVNEIEVFKWSWGLQAHSELSGLGPTRKASLGELDITKRVDRASTALMSALISNEAIKEAVLTVRKSGEDPLEYFVITLNKARITGLHAQSEDHVLTERLTVGALAARHVV